MNNPELLHQDGVQIESPKLRPRRVKQVVPGANVVDFEAHQAARAQQSEDDEKSLVATYSYLAGQTAAAPIQVVRCPLPGYGHLQVAYNLGVEFRKVHAFPSFKERGADEEQEAYAARYTAWLTKLPAFASIYVVEIQGWDLVDVYTRQPLPPPTVDDPSSFHALWMQNEPLATWITFAGYEEAKRQATGEPSAP